MKTLSLDLRERMLLAYDAEEGTREKSPSVSGFPLGMVRNCCNNAATPATSERGTTFPGASPKFWSGTGASSAVCWRSDRTLPWPNCGLPQACPAPFRPFITAAAALDLTHKKDAPRQQQDREDLKQARSGLAAGMASGVAGSLVFLDESAAKTNMIRLWGRARRGTRVHDSAPAGHWGTTTLIGSLRADGTTACMTIEEATDTEVFRAYVRQVLAPTLRTGDVVVMDNLSPHRGPETIGIIEQAGGAFAFCQPIRPTLQSDRKDVEQEIKGKLRAAKAGADAVSIMPSPAL